MEMRGVIFDLDGVLCHTDHYHYLAWKALADKLGVPFDEQVNNRLRGVSRMDCLDIILGLGEIRCTQEEKEQLAEEKNQRYRSYLATMGNEALADGAADVLCDLKAQGLKLAVGSSSKNAPFILERIGLAGYLDAVVDGSQITHAKPDPMVFLRAAQKLGLNPAECVVVEDATVGIEAAKAGGFYAIGIGDAANAPEADRSIFALTELITMCRKLHTERRTSGTHRHSSRGLICVYRC